MSKKWFVTLDRRAHGPFTESQITELFREGRLTRGDLAWSKGLQSWEPVEVHFPASFKEFFGQKQTQRSTLTAAKQEAQAPSSYLKSPDGKSNSDVLSTILLIGCLIIAGITTFLFLSLAYSADELIDSPALANDWFRYLTLSSLSILFLIVMAWGRSTKYWHHHSRQSLGGVIRLFCVFMSLILLLYVSTYGYSGLDRIQVAKARTAYNKYTVDINPATKVLSVSGIIGPGLADRIIESMTVHPDIRTIKIDSPGGLVDEGMAIARYLETVPESTVIASGTCNSACVLVLVAGKNRISDWNMKIGFHAVSPITDLGEATKSLSYRLGEESYSYLEKRGVPIDIISKLRGSLNDDLVAVSAISLVDKSVLTGLIDENTPIEINTAKWRMVEELIPQDDELGTLVVLRAIRNSIPDFVKMSADTLYTSLTSNDLELFKEALAAVMKSVRKLAMESADGAALNKYVAMQFLQLRHLARSEQWSACISYLNGDVDGAQAVMSRDLQRRENDAQAKLINSAAAKQFRKQPVPSWIDLKLASIYETVIPKAVELGFLNDDGEPIGDRGKCIYLVMLFEKILSQEEDTAAPMLRAIITK